MRRKESVGSDSLNFKSEVRGLKTFTGLRQRKADPLIRSVGDQSVVAADAVGFAEVDVVEDRFVAPPLDDVADNFGRGRVADLPTGK